VIFNNPAIHSFSPSSNKADWFEIREGRGEVGFHEE